VARGERDLPETVEHRWDILYRDYPEVYDAFASHPYRPRPVEVVHEQFDLSGKRVVDVGSGSGRSTLAVAEYASQVIGVEPEDGMLTLAREAAQRSGASNVEFVQGTKEHIPLPAASVDMLTSFTAGLDVAEAMRVVRPGGLVVSVDIPPRWYAGDLNSVVRHPTPELGRWTRQLQLEEGFSFVDFESVQEYGSVDDIVRTYGFIHGRRAIAHLRETGRTFIRWRFRIHYRTTPIARERTKSRA
jgi:ubiquinone/menaquinone biosynthesis C-methylase UbiE